MYHERLELKSYFEFLGNDNANPTLDLYLPYNMAEMNRSSQKRSCMIICPGGGYGGCSERESEPVALHFLAEGFNCFVLKYSVAPHRFPVQLREVAAVTQLIYANADSWNCDTEKIAIMGFSAGGHLAAHYSTMYDCQAVREVFPESKNVNATVLSYPVITADFSCTHHDSFLNLIGHAPKDKQEEEFFSCDKQVNDKTPPAFLWHTSQDKAVPVVNSLLYANALANHDIPVELHIYPYGAHGMSTCDEQTLDDVTNVAEHNRAWLDSLKKWLKLMDF